MAPTASSWFHAHAHSRYSTLDGMSAVPVLIAQAVANKQPALALTDHGNMGGVVQLYQGCQAAGIKPYPGLEGYLIDPKVDNWVDPAKGQKVGRYHFGLLALDLEGYKGLVKFTSLTHTRPRFSRFPRASLNDLATLGANYGEHLALTTGCYFGLFQQTLVNEDEAAARRVLEMYASMFPNTFVEVQNHGIIHNDVQGEWTDDIIVTKTFDMAYSLGLPVLATQDSHYHKQQEKEAHALMKRMVYSGAGDDEFPGDSFHLATTEWVEEHYTPEQWDVVEESATQLLCLHDLEIPPLDKFMADVPRTTSKPYTRIVNACWDKLEALGFDADDEYTARVEMELEVIKKLKMSSYFVIVLDFVEWCHDQKILIEARGSANGSLVLYLLGVTSVDPIKWGTQFDRFLSEDRIKPPDVDIDIEDSERPRALAYFRKKYGAVQIGTWSSLGSTIDQDTGEEKGSVLVSWKQGKRRELEAWARTKVDKIGEAKQLAYGTFEKKYGHVTSVRDVRKISERDYIGLRQMLKMNSVLRSYGVHAGGVLLSGEHVKVEDWIPTMLVASSDTTVTQYDMDDVEQFGLLKMDILGQSSLRVMRLIQEYLGSATPLDFEWIPEDDAAACRILREGRPHNGIFHYEGYSKAFGGKKMGVRSTMDAVLGQALFMPGAMDTGQTDLYLARRRSPAERRAVTYLHPIFREVLGETYGTVIFQEQVINIMRKLGMDIAGVNKFFKVVKDSGKGAVARNADRLREVREQFDDLCDAHDIDPDAAWAQTAGFVAYGFNRCATGHTAILVDMGLSGKTEMHRAGANQHVAAEMTVREFYDVFHGSKTPARDKYRYQGLRIAAHKDGRIVLDRVKDIWWAGRKTTVKVTLEDGKFITTTPNHKHLSKRGWVRADELTADDELATMGDYEHWSTPTGGTPSKMNGRKAAYEALPPYCQMCGLAEGRLEVAHLNHDRQDNSPENIRRLCNPCHKQWDYDTGRRVARWNKGRPIAWSHVVSIQKGLVEDVYDIEMEGDDHSWVGNGIVTHNSHATGYGIRSYRFAYLKAYYPLEFMAALLVTWAGRGAVGKERKSKEDLYIDEARRIRIPILPADVNVSGPSWTLDPKYKAIRRGLVSIPGIGPTTAEQIAANAPFTSVEDMIAKVPRRAMSGGDKYLTDKTLSGIIQKLQVAGALESLGVS